MSLDPNLPAPARSQVSAVVRRALGDETAEVAAWAATTLYGGGGAASNGVYRLAGTAQTTSGRKPWSVVLKVLQAPATGTAYLAIPSDDLPSAN
jgi:hypothetical protein